MWYRRVLAIRHAEIVPRLSGMAGGTGRYDLIHPQGLRVRWKLGDGSMLTVLANLSIQNALSIGSLEGRVLWREGASRMDRELGPWSVVWTLVC